MHGHVNPGLVRITSVRSAVTGVHGQYGEPAALPAVQAFGQGREHVLQDRLVKKVCEETFDLGKQHMLELFCLIFSSDLIMLLRKKYLLNCLYFLCLYLHEEITVSKHVHLHELA